MNSVETFTIKPTNKYNLPSPPSISLNALDLIGAPVSINNHRFFHRPSHLTPHSIVDTLKTSLAEALELYPPVAGTIRSNEKGEPYIALDGEGASFIVEMRDSEFDGDSDTLSPRPVLILPTPSCGLAVKVTQFSCGTIAVASSLHHWLADLAGFLDFLAVWAKLARGEAIDLQILPRDWSHTPARFFDCKNSKSLPPPPHGYRVLSSLPADPPIFAPAEAQTWNITASSLAKLKNDFAPTSKNSSDIWISSGDALTALLWGVITRARETAKVPHLHGFGRSSEESGTETIAIAADGRERSPNRNMVGGRYFGNFNLLFITTVPRDDLLSTNLEAASRVALALRTSLHQQLNPEAIVDRIEFMEAPEHAGRIVWAADVAFTNWCLFDLQGDDMDFGWGKPFDATAGGGSVLPGGFSRLIQYKSSGDVNILIAVENEAARAMQADPLLNKYATLLKIY